MKRDKLFADMFGHYWSKTYLRNLRKEIGVDAFDEIDWRKESALRFVSENLSECIRIFNHRDFPQSK